MEVLFLAIPFFIGVVIGYYSGRGRPRKEAQCPNSGTWCDPEGPWGCHTYGLRRVHCLIYGEEPSNTATGNCPRCHCELEDQMNERIKTLQAMVRDAEQREGCRDQG